MDLTRPHFVSRDAIFGARPHRAEAVRFTGLWCAGSCDALAGPTIAIVGTRAPSLGGLGRARELAAALSRAGLCVLSGLALGIDGAAHAGALAGATPTVGILGGGHRQFFPKRNRELAEAIVASGGAVLSPYPPDEPARPPQFLQRNGVVAALADAVVVVEAAERSGALNTAGWAAIYGIEVFAYPGDVDRSLAAGCNALIRDGATLVRDAGDVLEALGFADRLARALDAAAPSVAADAATAADAASERDPLAGRLVALLEHGPQTLDDLVAASAATTGSVLATLVRLEIDGAVASREAGTWARAGATSRSHGGTARVRRGSDAT
ncbi:MAG: hypothetical protein NVSMB21_03990 [Vulcanimicrobiaceae bacterium]